MSSPAGFDLPDSILRVLKAWELGNDDLHRKYCSYIKIQKIQNFILIHGVAGTGLVGFSGDPRESSSGRSCRSRVAGARSARMRATSGQSLFTETLYVAQIIPKS